VRWLVSVSIAVLAVACGSELPSPTRVDKLRLLALVSDTPDALAGTDVTVRAVWADGSSRSGRPVYFHWWLCAEGSDHEPRTCLRDRADDVLLDGAGSAGADRVTIPAGRLALPASGADLGYFVLVAICPDSAPAWNATQGQFDCPNERAIAYAMREGIQGFRRVVVRSRERVATVPLNRNPDFLRVRVGTQDVPADAATVTLPRCAVALDATCPTVAVAIEATTDSVEGRGDGTDETLLVSFFATDGVFDRPRAVGSMTDPRGVGGSLAASWSAPRTAAAISMWVVLRDGRGGESTRMANVRVE